MIDNTADSCNNCLKTIEGGYAMKRALTAFFLISVLLLSSCVREAAVPADTSSPSDSRRLHITAVIDEGAGFTTVDSDTMGGNLTDGLSYLDLKDVQLETEDGPIPLKTALANLQITVEEIFAFARLDARAGICREHYVTENGLTRFVYAYPEFDLYLTYDVFEAPDGSDYLINDICLAQPNSSVSFFYTDEKTGLPLDREEWGLRFVMENVTPGGISIECTQAEGVQIGTLTIEDFCIYSVSADTYLDTLPDSGSNANPNIPIPSNAQTQIDVDWSQIYGLLPEGNYELILAIRDIFDPAQVHPFMRDYADKQNYGIPFEIEG